MKMDSNLLKLLYQNETTRARFFTDIDGISVFDKVGFGWVINNREFLPDSYTRYKNKIGLTNSNGDYISTSNDVELVFPYKDCVLEGGQTKEDQKRSEIFYNETLAPDEVDRLLYPKVLTNAKRYTANGIEENISDIVVNTPVENSAPHILNVSFGYVRSEVLLHSLETEGIYVSSGSACSSHKKGPSYVLSAIGTSPKMIDGSIRFSLSEFTTEEEIDYTLEKLSENVRKIRKLMKK
jgi:hypothetical protein